MNEDEIRWLILDKLYKEYLADSHTFVMKDKLLQAQGILGLDANALDRSVRYLEQKGLIDVRRYLGGGFIARLNAFGIDAVEQKREREPPVTEPTAILEEELDRLLRDRIPSLVDDLVIARSQLAKGDKEIDFQSVALNCRNLFLAFADAVYRPEYLPKDEAPPDRNQAKRKLKFALQVVNAGKAERGIVEAIIDEFDALVDFIQKHVHDRQTGRPYAAACLVNLETAMLVVLLEVGRYSSH